MAELEIHHESEHSIDPAGQRVGVLAALLAVGLAVVTIASHRAHTEGVLLKTEANDQWALHQSKRLKLHTLELGEDLIGALGAKNDSAAKVLQRYGREKKRYEEDAKRAQEHAEEKVHEGNRIEARALRYDFGEGLLEIGLVLTSLYFISRKNLFPVTGIAAGLIGAAVAITGLFI